MGRWRSDSTRWEKPDATRNAPRNAPVRPAARPPSGFPFPRPSPPPRETRLFKKKTCPEKRHIPKRDAPGKKAAQPENSPLPKTTSKESPQKRDAPGKKAPRPGNIPQTISKESPPRRGAPGKKAARRAVRPGGKAPPPPRLPGNRKESAGILFPERQSNRARRFRKTADRLRGNSETVRRLIATKRRARNRNPKKPPPARSDHEASPVIPREERGKPPNRKRRSAAGTPPLSVHGEFASAAAYRQTAISVCSQSGYIRPISQPG